MITSTPFVIWLNYCYDNIYLWRLLVISWPEFTRWTQYNGFYENIRAYFSENGYRFRKLSKHYIKKWKKRSRVGRHRIDYEKHARVKTYYYYWIGIGYKTRLNKFPKKKRWHEKRSKKKRRLQEAINF